jgi:asparagine synthase (glutamine-hydrolysing)
MHALAFYPIWELYGFISENGVKVTLDGQGPDEMMGGYFETIQSALRNAVSSFSPGRILDIYKTYSKQGETRYRSSKGSADAELLRLVKTPFSRLKKVVLECLEGRAKPQRKLEFAHHVPDGLNSLAQSCIVSFVETTSNDFAAIRSLLYGSWGGMSDALLDYRIVEFAFTTGESIVGDGYTKRVLRRR